MSRSSLDYCPLERAGTGLHLLSLSSPTQVPLPLPHQASTPYLCLLKAISKAPYPVDSTLHPLPLHFAPPGPLLPQASHSLVFLLDSTSTATDSPFTRPWGSSHGSQPRPGSSKHSTLSGQLLKFEQLRSVPVCPLGYLPPPRHAACKKGPWCWLSCPAPAQQCLLPDRAWVRVKKEWHHPGPKARLLGATAGTVGGWSHPPAELR